MGWVRLTDLAANGRGHDLADLTTLVGSILTVCLHTDEEALLQLAS